MSKFNDLLFSTSGLVKHAGPDIPNLQQLEGDFGRIAYNFLVDRAPRLINYLLGFEVVDGSEDGTRSVGIFGFKIGEIYYYVPVFFINNQIKGMDFLFDKTHNVVMPLQESVISNILQHQAVELGRDGGDGTNNDLMADLAAPDFEFLKSPPGVKAAHIRSDLHNTWRHIRGGIEQAIKSDPAFQMSFAGAVQKLEKVAADGFYKGATGCLKPYLITIGGPKAVNSFVKSLENYKYANAAASFYDIPDLVVRNFHPGLAPKKAGNSVTLITSDSPGDSLDTPERAEVVRYGFTIRDLRPKKDKSVLYDADFSAQFYTPTEPGLYDVLLNNGGAVKAWVLSPRPNRGFPTLIVEDTEGIWIKPDSNLNGTSVFVVGDKHTPAKTLFDRSIRLKDLQVNKKYILVNSKMDVSSPFEVRAVMSSEGLRPTISIYMETGHYAGESILREESPDALQLADFERDTLQVVNGTLIVPSNWRAFEVTRLGYRAQDVIRLGNITDVTLALHKEAYHNLVVESADKGLEYTIRLNDFNSGPYAFKQAAWKLVNDFGLSVPDTFKLLKHAASNIKSRHMIKLAQGVGVAMPGPQMPPQGFDPYTGAMTTAPYAQTITGQFTGVPPLSDPMQQGFNMGGQTESEIEAAKLQEEIMNLAGEAAATGQKTVFDHSTIAGLARLYDVGNIIDMYLPDMLKALDRLGRVLFLFYWKNEEFNERYGITDLTAMEDSLRSVFKSFGDLVMQLKEKSLDPSLV